MEDDDEEVAPPKRRKRHTLWKHKANSSKVEQLNVRCPPCDEVFKTRTDYERHKGRCLNDVCTWFSQKKDKSDKNHLLIIQVAARLY